MFDRVCLVSYHELGLKGKNRAVFEHRLVDNLKAALADYGAASVKRISGHLLVELGEGADPACVAQAAAKIPGVARVRPAWRVDRSVGQMCKAAQLALGECGDFETFKVDAHRSNTDFELNSLEVNKVVGAMLVEGFCLGKQVRMKDPDAIARIDIVQGSAYVSAQSEVGVGGLPVGSAGKVCCLLSGGIDSPVALWKMVRRGAVAVGVHFSGRPQTSASSEEVVDDIARALGHAAGLGRVYTVAFGDYQRKIAQACDPDLRVILYRRLMFCVAERIARLERAKALVTGESLGQVASQTLENIAAVDEVVSMPVFRPLIGDDKQEIIALAKRIGTYEISIRKHDDCCTLFMPRNPETHAKLPKVLEAWGELDCAAWALEIMRNLEHRDYPCPAYKPPRGAAADGERRCGE